MINLTHTHTQTLDIGFPYKYNLYLTIITITGSPVVTWSHAVVVVVPLELYVFC